jgi:hypothetical protein
MKTKEQLAKRQVERGRVFPVVLEIVVYYNTVLAERH